MVRLVDPAAPAEAPLPPRKPDDKPVDWSKLAVGPTGSEPREVLLVRYPRVSGAAELDRLFSAPAGGLGPPPGMGGGNMGGGGMGGGGGGARSVVLERDQLVWGELDARSPLDVAHQFQRAIADARLVVIPGCGHVSNLERPEEVNAAVREFCLAAAGPVDDAR